MILTRPVIFALCTLLLAAPGARAEEPVSENAIVKASKSHTGAAVAAGQFQQSASMKAAASLMSHISEAAANDTVQDAANAAAIAPAAAAGSASDTAAPLASAVETAPRPAFEVRNELIPARNMAMRRIPQVPAAGPAYNQ